MPQHSAAKPIGLPFIELLSVDSTNNYARRQIHAGLAQHGMAFFAQEQLEGKGQRGRTWSTEKGANIILSLVLNPSPLQLTQQFQLSACVATVVRDFFSRYAGEGTKIKWPNDLYWQDRKAGGILIENIISGQKAPDGKRTWTSIVGIGININQTSFPAELPNPVSLRQITGRAFDTALLAKELCSLLDTRFRQLTDDGFADIFHAYSSHLYKKNQFVRLRKEGRVFEAKIVGVSLEGKLMTQHRLEQEYSFTDVEWVL